jgi:hypothetical protein
VPRKHDTSSIGQEVPCFCVNEISSQCAQSLSPVGEQLNPIRVFIPYLHISRRYKVQSRLHALNEIFRVSMQTFKGYLYFKLNTLIRCSPFLIFKALIVLRLGLHC